jgi:hypothetical protein
VKARKGRMEDWKIGRMGGRFAFHPSILPVVMVLLSMTTAFKEEIHKWLKPS